MSLTVTLRSSRGEAPIPSTSDLDRRSADLATLPAPLGDGLRRLSNDLKRLYDLRVVAKIVAGLEAQLVVVSTERFGHPTYIADDRGTHLRCKRRKCESL